tara:strand:+ start:53 stop:619 length:567 start_codon:yes stop_codon:yes gene_type:complete
MELNNKIQFEHKGEKCELRPLQASDVSKNYVKSLREQEYIKMTSPNINKAKQRKYIEEIQVKENQFINGLFVEDVFIGSSGVQLENKFLNLFKSNNEQIALVGILLFDNNYLGKGFGKILVWASTFIFYKSLGINFFGAGMKKSNLVSLYSFKSCGYEICNKEKKSYKVLLNYDNLIKPETIHKARIV